MRRSADPHRSTADRYRAFAEVEARGMSECYEGWAAGIAADDTVIELIDTLPAARRQPNLVFSAARLVGAEVVPYSDFAGWLARHWREVADICLTHTTQTNEPGRCATLLPMFAAIPGPLALIEVGASAGLCLYPDRYSYDYRRVGSALVHAIDPASGESTVRLGCEVRGALELPDQLPEVVWRAGIDLNPLDVDDPEHVAWLDALVWPEHADRRARLHEAVAIARTDPPHIMRGDLLACIDEVVAQAPPGATPVVFHTAVLAYVSEGARAEFSRLMQRLPVVWLANEAQGVMPGVMERVTALGRRPPSSADFVMTLDGEPVAFAQPHGRILTGLHT